MYARYVPPSKGGKTVNAAPSPLPPARAANSSPATDTFTYSRYVPGAKPAPKAAETPQVQYFDDEPSPPKAKRKWDSTEGSQDAPKPGSKKSKTDVMAMENAQQESEETPKKKKKVRRGKRRTGVSKDEEDPSTETATPKPKSQEVEDKDDHRNGVSESQEESQPLEEEPEKTKKKTEEKEGKDRKEKKRKKREVSEQLEQTAPEVEDGNADDADVSMADAAEVVEEDRAAPEPVDSVTTNEEKKEQKGEKKKKKKKQKEPEPEKDNADEGDHQRHKAVLERLEKSLKLASETIQDSGDDTDQGELHGLEPLPQPEPVSLTISKPSYQTLPPWLAEPVRVSQNTRTPFAELGILPKACRLLEEKGFRDAFAVQTAAIPLLLPTSKQRPGDVLVSAATGSGKTLAYALPVVRDISQGVVTRLRALVVLPTRELVKQAQEAFELCAKAFEGSERKRVRIGVSVGSQSLRQEQEAFMDREIRYDPEAYKKLQEECRRQRQQKAGLSAAEDVDNLDTDEADPRLSSMDGYVVDFPSKVDVLICTPGRLVEHVEQTPGFSLDYVRWLVVDEADKLLAQSFQGWLDLVMEKFRVNKFSARDFPDMDLSGVRKVILSATLTRDLSLLNQLGLQRPRLIVLESDGDAHIAEHSLPALLREHAVRVHDTNLKPLYLLELLQGQHMLMAGSAKDGEHTKPDESNESALRLSRLLALLDPSLASHIGTLTSTTPTHIRRKTLRAFTASSSPIRLLIASDLVARGIDLPNLDHVINYDLPPSVAGYVHRVGRTARAGRSGCAWTLVADDESGWFWGKIAKGAGVRRAQKVERTRIEEMGEERVQEYEAALEKLGKEAGR
ncbi:hypothetical protein ACJZ2D_005048 [Fusarium nematophilum]